MFWFLTTQTDLYNTLTRCACLVNFLFKCTGCTSQAPPILAANLGYPRSWWGKVSVIGFPLYQSESTHIKACIYAMEVSDVCHLSWLNTLLRKSFILCGKICDVRHLCAQWRQSASLQKKLFLEHYPVSGSLCPHFHSECILRCHSY